MVPPPGGEPESKAYPANIYEHTRVAIFVRTPLGY